MQEVGSWPWFAVGSTCLVVEDLTCCYLIHARGLTHYQLGVALIARSLFILATLAAIRFVLPMKKPLLIGSVILAFVVFALPERSVAGLALIFASSATAFVALAYKPVSQVRVVSKTIAFAAIAMYAIAVVLLLMNAIWLPMVPLATVVVVITFTSLRHAGGGSRSAT